MVEVKIVPMPMWMRRTPQRLWPHFPPIFTGLQPGEQPSEADKELARELFQALDEESKAWYRRFGSRLFDGL